MSPLFATLSGQPKTPKILVWANDMLKVFQDSKTALAGATMLTHTYKNAPTALKVDASIQAVGAVLEQLVHEAQQPLAFFANSFSPP